MSIPNIDHQSFQTHLLKHVKSIQWNKFFQPMDY